MKDNIYIPRTGDLILFPNFQYTFASIINYSYEGGCVKYQLIFPDIQPLIYVRRQMYGRRLFEMNGFPYLSYNNIKQNMNIVIHLYDLKEMIRKKKWIIHKKKQ